MPIGRWLYEAMIYSFVLCCIILISQIIHARLWLNDYPAPIRLAADPLSRGEKLAKRLLDIPLMIIKVGYPVFSAFVYKAAMGQTFSLWYGFTHLLMLYSMFVIIHLLVLDGLIFCLITPKFVVIDGTRELKSAYKKFSFHAKKALSEFGLSVMFSALVTGVLVV
jgi:hypothetical protein